MSGVEEEWVKAAMSDDTMVVELLVSLHGDSPPPLKRRPSLPLEWSVRQRRSKPVFANTNPKKQAQSQRASPTTPLSWSGATSLSGGSGGAGAGGGSEESSRPHVQKLTRSKVIGDGEKNPSKRSRKKKTLAELKDEEILLLKERRELKRRIASFQMTLEKQQAINKNLKRMKIELQPLPDRGKAPVTQGSVSDQVQPKTMPHLSSSNGCSEANTSDQSFMLPDLNIPFDDDRYPDVICNKPSG